MARIRTIKPAHWNDRLLPEISLQAHLFWIGTWNFSDDKGVFESDPLLLKAQIFPRRTDIRVEQVKQWLDQLEKARFVVPFSYNGIGYYASRTFRIHQKVEKPQPSQVPEDELIRIFAEYSPNAPRTVDDGSRTLPSVLYGNVLESSVGESGGEPPTLTPHEIEFNEVVAWMKVKCPRVLQMKEPLTQAQYFRLKESYGAEAVSKTLQEMHNWGKLTKEKVSANLTFITFQKRQAQPNPK